MLNIIGNYLRSKADTIPYIDKAYGLATFATRTDGENTVSFPVVNNEQIGFDTNNVMVFFMLDGEIERESEDGEISCEDKITENYVIKAYLFVSGKETNDCVSFTQQIAYQLAKYISADNSSLEATLSLQEADITAGGFNFNKQTVWEELHEGIPFKLGDNQQLASITFDVEIVGVESCFVQDACPDVPIPNFCDIDITINGQTFDTVNEDTDILVLNENGERVGEKVGDNWVVPNGGGGNATVRNSDSSYSTTVACGATLVLPDETYNVYLGGVLQDSVTSPALKAETINILWQ